MEIENLEGLEVALHRLSDLKQTNRDGAADDVELNDLEAAIDAFDVKHLQFKTI